jgi:hypothetical protein
MGLVSLACGPGFNAHCIVNAAWSVQSLSAFSAKGVATEVEVQAGDDGLHRLDMRLPHGPARSARAAPGPFRRMKGAPHGDDGGASSSVNPSARRVRFDCAVSKILEPG